MESVIAKRIVIYGGSGGIGSATARLLHGGGYELHLVGRSEDKLALIATELQAGYTVGDVCDETLFPGLLPASNNAAFSVTIYNAASSTLTQKIGLIIVAIGMPMVISYTILIYWTFRGKVELDEGSY